MSHTDKEPGAKPPGAPKEPKGKCVVCNKEGQKKCKLTADQVGPEGLKTDVCPADADVPPEDCPDPFVVSADFEGTDSVTATFFDPYKEGGTEIELDYHGGCGTKIVGTVPTRISFFMKVEHDPGLVDGESEKEETAAVAEYLQENLGKKTFCEADEAPDNGEQEEIFIAPLPNSSPGGRKLEDSDVKSFVTGFVPCSASTAAFYSTGRCGEKNSNCHVYVGCANVYCDLNASKTQCYGSGVTDLMENAHLAADADDRILSVQVIGSKMDSEGAGNGAIGGDVASVIGLETNDGGDSSISAVGIGLAAGFSVLAALAVLLAVRKNRKAYTRDISFLDMEDMCSVDGDNIHLKPGDSSFDGTEIMSEGGTPSPAGSKWRKSRPGHVVDEDDSVLSGNNRQIVPRELVYGGALAPSNLARDHSTLDVHQCNSAMCEICLSRGVNPRFVPAHLEDSYHVEGDDRLNASDLSYGSRNYPMEDTVDF